MNRSLILMLLLSAALLCDAAPALEPVTCTEDSGDAAARLAMHHINEHHNHGFKFKLNNIKGKKVDEVDTGCNIMLDLELDETTCHIVNPKHFEECDKREKSDTEVMAKCNVEMIVKDGNAEVTKYNCSTHPAKLVAECPDCPTLMPLNNAEGLNIINKAISVFNQNTTNQRYYVLQSVGRIKSWHVMMAGMFYYAEFALVETHCPMGSRIMIEACNPLCPDRAHHAYCHASTRAVKEVNCIIYPPLNTTTLDKEPTCPDSRRGPPPHAGGRGPPPHAGGRGPPPHAGGRGPPPHAGGQGPPPGQDRRPHHFCHGLSEPSIHPICPWPRPTPPVIMPRVETDTNTQ